MKTRLYESHSFSHRENVIHADLKPENILIEEGINSGFNCLVIIKKSTLLGIQLVVHGFCLQWFVY